MATQPKKGKFVVEEIRMKFDDPDPRKHDVVLVVDGQKFYCSKATLAKHTHYFNAMFFAGYVENTMREIDLGDPLSADEFQIFLETVHGVKCLTDENVQGVLRLSVTWLADIVRNRCIEFLMGPDTKKTRKETFDMSIELNVPKLMKLILPQVKLEKNLEDLLSGHDLTKITQPIVGMIFAKHLALSNPELEVPDVAPSNPVVQAPHRNAEQQRFHLLVERGLRRLPDF